MIMNDKKDPNQEKAKLDFSDEDLIIELTDEVEKKSDDDQNVIQLDNRETKLESDELDTPTDEVVFNLGEKIELKQDDDDDEKYEFFEIDDEETDDEKDRLSLLDNLDLDFGEEDDIISLDAEQEEKFESQALESDDPSKTDLTDDLPDLLAEMEFEFDEDDEESVVAADESPTGASDNVIAKAVEQSAGSDTDAEQIDLTEKEEELIDDGEAIALEDHHFDDDDILSPEQTEIADLELDDELLNFEEDVSLKSEDDIIEISEFDQHFPEEDEKILEQAGVLDATSEVEDEFLELIDIEEDDSQEDEAHMAPEDFEMKKADAQISSFLNDKFEEDVEFKSEVSELVEEPSNEIPETAMDAEAILSEDDEFDLKLDTDEITQQIDGLDDFLTDESDAEPKAEYLSEEETQESQAEPELESLSEDDSEEDQPELSVAPFPEDLHDQEEPEDEVLTLSEDQPEEEEPEPVRASFAEDYPGNMEDESAVALGLEDDLNIEPAETAIASFPDDLVEEEEPEPIVASLSEVLPEEEESGPDAMLEPEVHAVSEESLQEDVVSTPEIVESEAITPEAISAAIERIINDKFSGQIESIIYQVIEKAVTNEIERLKTVLLEGGSLDDEL